MNAFQRRGPRRRVVERRKRLRISPKTAREPSPSSNGFRADDHLVQQHADRHYIGPRHRTISPANLSGRLASGVPAHTRQQHEETAPSSPTSPLVSATYERGRSRRSSTGPRLRHDHVGGLEVAMHDTVLVRVRERIGGLQPGDRRPPPTGSAPYCRDNLRSERPSTSSSAMKAAPVRPRRPRGRCRCFGWLSAAAFRASRRIRAARRAPTSVDALDDLEGDLPTESGVVGEKHGAHAAAVEQPLQAMARQGHARCETTALSFFHMLSR